MSNNARRSATRIWSKRLFLSPSMAALGDGERAINAYTFLDRVRYRFFPLHADKREVETQFVNAMNRGQRTLNQLVQTHRPEGAEKLRTGVFPENTDITELIKEARRRYRSLMRNGTDVMNRRSVYEIVRAVELGHQTLKIDTDKEVHQSLRHYASIIEWLKKFLEIGEGVACINDPFTHAFPTGIGTELLGLEDVPFKSRLKWLRADGSVSYASLLIKTYLDLIDEEGRKSAGIRDYTGVELDVKADSDVAQIEERFRDASPTGLLEAYKQRVRGRQVKDNPHSSSVFGLTKFIVRIPMGTEPIKGHPLGDLLTESLPVEVQILSLEDYELRAANPEAAHAAYKARQFERVFPALYPMEIYRPFF